jgi:uncharacterized membrane protein YhaH (DUF805 family)
MGFGEAIQSALSKYVTFSGRARRAEYWWFALFVFLMGGILSGVDEALFDTFPEQAGPLAGIFSLAMFLPQISVTVRRLHDTGRSGWWFWILLIPLIGWLLMLYWMIKSGDSGTNAFGPDPIEEQWSGGSSIPRVPRN